MLGLGPISGTPIAGDLLVASSGTTISLILKWVEPQRLVTWTEPARSTTWQEPARPVTWSEPQRDP
jgi:hypothetical protein